MNPILYADWDENPIRIQAISHQMPSAPNLPLSGGCTTRMPLERFLKELERDLKNQTGKYYVRVRGCDDSEDEANIYTLKTWQVCRPDDGTYEAVVILYYAPINTYLTLKKHFGDEDAQAYLDQIAARSAAITALTDALD
ncbi:hypothetical protein [Calothrix sp. PCC 7507]|uniref:hypothetical protein n=1 Tax=Calothrix sp. PCC 7507 TaxID=99598 RepID=UPI00029EF14A|nr:hypothetical protein [Calothrix sp. PCC 7507]AFY36035.1 hypothetical protein Cal7507_5713 [Calothrix sp. PCC 7507]